MTHINSVLRPRLSNILALFALIVSFAGAARAQSALDGFDPNANGVVRVVVVQPDGKILIGGHFTSLSPNGGATVMRNRIARLNPDGTLDVAFNPNADNSVHSIAVQADGKILVGGTFTTIGGQTRSKIARLDAITGLADSFDPSANDLVFSIAVQADGKILVGGSFVSIGGVTRNRIARLDANTGLADSFDPNASFNVYAIAVQSDGKILVGGGFMSIGGQPRSRMARLDAVTGLADSFDPNVSLDVYCIAVQADSKILAGGAFNSIGGTTRNFIARLDASTGLPDSFDPNANTTVYAIRVQADGKILAGGDFSGENSIGGQTRNRIARLDPVTGLADSFDPNATATVNSIAEQADGKILAGGVFTTLAPNGGLSVIRNNIARLESDGRADRTLDINVIGSPGVIFATAIQPDGKIIIGGRFSMVHGVERGSIARLNTDGTLDMGFNPNAGSGEVRTIALQSDGKILVGGNFGSIGSVPRNYIARLDPVTGGADSFDPRPFYAFGLTRVDSIAVQQDGKVLVVGDFTLIGGQSRNYIARLDPITGAADNFNPNANNTILAMALQTDGDILVGGAFTNIGGQPRNCIARINHSTGMADSFDPNSNNVVFTIAVQADGKILAGGRFGNIGGQPRTFIARLDASTGTADSFNPGAIGTFVLSIAVQSDGKVLTAGDFTTIGGQPRNNIARLNPITGVADSFNANASNVVYSIVLQSDGKILVGGNFAGIGGQPRSRFARLTNDIPARSKLTVTKTAVTLIRNGSNSQFSRVAFDQSANNGASYTFLGDATGNFAGGYTLNGINLPFEQNILIRARGYNRSGFQNGSESIEEKIQAAFLLPTISGMITYGNAIGAPTPRFVSNVLLSGAGSVPVSALTGFPDGTYSLSGFGSGAYTVTPSKTGGVKGAISSFDAGKIAQHAAGIPPGLNVTQLIVADVSGNGTVSSFDAGQLARYAAGLPGSESTGNWIFAPVNRNYTSVTGNITGEDFIALLMGEVSGNWTSTGARPVAGK